MKPIYKVLLNGRLTQLFDDKEEAIQYAEYIKDSMVKDDVVYICEDKSEIIFSIEKGDGDKYARFVGSA